MGTSGLHLSSSKARCYAACEDFDPLHAQVAASALCASSGKAELYARLVSFPASSLGMKC